MKKLAFILGALMLLTGCQSLDEMKSQEEEREKLHITPYTEQVMEAPSNASRVLQNSVQSLEYTNNDIWFASWGDDLTNRLGINAERIMVRFSLGGKNDEDILRNLENIVGEELQSFIDEVKNDEEEYYLAEKVIGDYGIACYKAEDNVTLYIIPSQSSYLDEAKRNQIKAFCGEEMIVSGATAGKEKSMIELSFPSYQIRKTTELNNTTAYYQIFSDKENEIEKIRMVINQYQDGYKEGILEEDKLLPLRRMLQEMQVGTEAEMKLIGGINQAVNQGITQQKGKTEHFEYTIRRSDADVYFEKLITVEIDF